MATLYRVTYHASEDAPAEPDLTRHVCSSYDVEHDVLHGDHWPRPQVTYARWEPVAETLNGPRQIGNLYGMPLYESIFAAGEREAVRLGLGAR